MEQMDLIDWLDGNQATATDPIHTAPPFIIEQLKAHHAGTGSLRAISSYHFRSNGTLSKYLPRKSTASDFKSI